MAMGKDEESPRFVPLVRESSVVVQDNPWLPDDIELIHEKHQRVLRSWESKYELEVDNLSSNEANNEDEGFRDEYTEVMNKTRRRTVLLVVSFCFICVCAILVVFVTVRFGLEGRSKPPSTRSTGQPTSPPPTEAPTETPDRRPTTEELVRLPPSTIGTPLDSTETPTIENVETFIPDAEAFGIDETYSPSVETSTFTSSVPDGQANSMTPTLLRATSSTPSTVTDTEPEVSIVPSSSPRTCNGLASNCDRPVNEVMFATLHNAMSSEEDGFYGPSHELRLEDALVAGYRGLMIESCDCGIAGIQLCSAFCFSGTRDPARVFSNIVEFLNEEENANEVIILLIKVDDQSLFRLFDTVFDESPKMRSLMYSHPGVGTEWPLLGDLIELNKRLIIFKHGDGLDCNTQYTCPQGVHNTFDYMFGTPIDLKGTDELFDYNISCAIQQGSSSSDFFVMNHFANGVFGKADAATAQVENSLPNIRKRIKACRNKIGRDPSLLVVDYWNIGDALEIVNKRNTWLANNSSSGRQ